MHALHSLTDKTNMSTWSGGGAWIPIGATMPCFTTLCYAMRQYVIACYAMLWCAVRWYIRVGNVRLNKSGPVPKSQNPAATTLWYAMSCHAMPEYEMLRYIMLWCTMVSHVVLWYVLRCYTNASWRKVNLTSNTIYKNAITNVHYNVSSFSHKILKVHSTSTFHANFYINAYFCAHVDACVYV